jgi:hypothetical protein
LPPAGFEPAIPAGNRPQTLVLDRSATGIGPDPRVVQLVASHYTDRAIAVHPGVLYACKTQITRTEEQMLRKTSGRKNYLSVHCILIEPVIFF